MTKISFSHNAELLTGFTFSGHCGYASAGEDIVCAALTSAARLTECIISDIMGLSPVIKMTDGTLELLLSQKDALECQSLLSGLLFYLRELEQEYPQHIKLLEV